ncbi:MAG: hypothetical protein IT442_02320, partial [Phycisphaeraceae bacterium]|nr:hypothetical protein [Phycisphaeraceae bacterium]
DRLQPGGHGPIDQNPQAFDFEHFFTLLHKIGYRGRVSIECQWKPELAQAGGATAAFLREAWRQAGRVEA